MGLQAMEFNGIEYTSVKDYAEGKGISVSAVNQSLHRQKYRRLAEEGHIFREGSGGRQKIWLDSEAVKALDNARATSPVVIDSAETQRQHREELKAKDDRIADLEEQLKEAIHASRTLADSLKSITEDNKRLEDKSAKFDQLALQLTDSQKETKEAEDKARDLQNRLAESEKSTQAAEERAKELEEKIDNLKNRSLWQRIRNRD